MLRLLLDCGADVNAQGGIHGNALAAAFSRGHTEAVQLLFEWGADVNAHGGLDGKAVFAAVRGGHTDTLRLLNDKRVRVLRSAMWSWGQQ